MDDARNAGGAADVWRFRCRGLIGVLRLGLSRLDQLCLNL
jgi:hypothetical protein